MAGEFFFNGVDGTTGLYLLPPLTPEAVSRRARGESFDTVHLDELRWAHERATETVFGPGEGLDPRDLSQVGWGAVFVRDADPAVREALRELLEHRRRQATAVCPEHYREFWGESAYRPGESKAQFLARNGAAPGPVDPSRVPYYLLLVGSGGEIPFSVQYQLDVQYAVGRLVLDTAEEYRRYAAGVVAAETRPLSRDRVIAFFAPQNRGDRATALSRTNLIEPLVHRLAADHVDWEVRSTVEGDATKECLVDMLGGGATPSLLFTAGHGAAWPSAHPAQPRCQGALVCQEWPGPGSGKPLAVEQYLSADDVPDDALVQGLIAFHFACFGAGTPEWDGFAHRDEGTTRARLAPGPMISALPRRLLGHPRGGALAVAGHVDRAWSYSFSWPGAGQQTEVYRSCLERLLRGHPIGSAFDYVNQRYAELSSDLSTALEEVKYGRRPDHLALATMWTANNDARGFVVLGDPAVRIPGLDGSVPPPSGPHARRHADRETVRAGANPSPGSGEEVDRAPEQPAGPDPHDELRAARRRVVAATERLAEALESAADGLAELDVATYSSPEPTAAHFDMATTTVTGARLRVRSRCGLAGHLATVLAEDDPLDAEVRALHLDLLKRAHAARSDLLAALVPVLRDLLDALEKP